MSKTLYAEFTVKPGSEARVAEMMLELTRHVRQEPGNELFLPYTREENPRDYFVFEVYAMKRRSRTTSERTMAPDSMRNWPATSRARDPS